METNRIDLALSLASKNTQAKAATNGNNGAFADMLFGAMGQKAGLLSADKAQVKPAETYAQRRRFDDYRPYQFDSRDTGTGQADRRVDNSQTRPRPGTDDSATTTQRAPQPRAEHVVHHTRAAESTTYGDSNLGDSAEIGTDGAVDRVTDIDATDSDKDASITGNDCGKQGAGDDTAGSETALIAVTAAVAKPDEEPVKIDIDIDPTAAAAAAGKTESLGASAATPEEIAAAAALAATKALPEGAASAGNEDIIPASSSHADDAAVETSAKQAVTFAAMLALTDTGEDAAGAGAEGQANAIAARNEQQLEDAGSSFRRNSASARRNQGNGAGAAGAQANTPHQPTITAATAAESHTSGTTALQGTTSLAGGTVPIGFDTGLGNAAGLSNWNLHLGQNAALRRGDFVANLRQHLQNLPAHEQVALTIQRSLRDGGGNITLQLSPAELGRIHLKLKIDEENNVQASVVVERPATLELLQRDMKALERALQEAGLKAGPGDLSFSLQGGDPEAFAREFGSGSGNGSNGSGRTGGGDSADDAPVAMTAAVVDTADGWVDVQV